jgi:predicted enzyme related to lactoylglutathione lyase
MFQRNYGIIINVDDLDRARIFYRETLLLGAPVLDSNHWVEFQLKNGLVLGVRQQHKANQQKGCNTMWVYFTEDYNTIRQQLLDAGFPPLKIASPPVGLKSEIFSDPEGNRFTLALKPQ